MAQNDGGREMFAYSSSRFYQEGSRGSTLILFLGIVAALCVLAVALVTVLANAQHFTSRDKARTTAFDVAEGAVDVTMQSLSTGWPTESNPWTNASFTANAPAFANTFGVTYGAAQGDAVWVSVVDDTSDSPWDAGNGTSLGNGRLWVDAQARVNGVSARIRAMVEARFYEPNVPRGVAVCSEGRLLSNAAGGNTASGKNKIGMQDVSIGGPQPVAIAIWGLPSEDPPVPPIENSEVAWPYVDQNPPGMPHADELITPQMITDLTLIAKQTGKLFENGALPGHDDFYGLCVVKAPAGTTITLGQSGGGSNPDPYNSPTLPGMLLVLGGATLKLTGNTQYYGVVYSEGEIAADKGNPIIFGMVVTKGSFDMRGVAQVIYREDCLINLNHQFQTSTKLVPNFWRELTPVAHTPTPAP